MVVAHENNDGRQRSLESQIFINGGDPFKALEMARQYDKITITISLELVERAFMAWYINFGWSDEMIAGALSTDERTVTVARIKRMRGKLDETKD